MRERFERIFQGPKPIIGMIHLAGDGPDEKDSRALDEIEVYESCGIDGAIVENYHGTDEDVQRILGKVRDRGTTLKLGVNILKDCPASFEFAYQSRNLGGFVQIDSIEEYALGSMGVPGGINAFNETLRRGYPQILVMGGIHFKGYQHPSENQWKRNHILASMDTPDVVVTTGGMTGHETPLQKLKDFREILGENRILIVGSGLNSRNLKNQLSVADGAIVGSYFKDGITRNPVIEERVREIVYERDELVRKLGI